MHSEPKATHTPGPWKVHSYNGKFDKTEPIWVLKADEDHSMQFVARMGHSGLAERDGQPSRETEISNARLIAAAPQMLEALERGVYVISGGDPRSVSSMEPWAQELVTLFNAAIAAAKG